jgi:hypothetical protein
MRFSFAPLPSPFVQAKGREPKAAYRTCYLTLGSHTAVLPAIAFTSSLCPLHGTLFIEGGMD